MEQKNEKKSVWGVLLKVIIAVASAIAGALGISALLVMTAGCFYQNYREVRLLIIPLQRDAL